MAVKIIWTLDFQIFPNVRLKSFLGRELLFSVCSHSTKADQMSLKICTDPGLPVENKGYAFIYSENMLG